MTLATFTDSFTGAVSTYWKQYGGSFTANGTNITSTSGTVTALRLIYDIGDQSADGDVSVKIVTITANAATFYSGVMARWTDDHSNTAMTGYAVAVDVSTGEIKILKVTAHNTYAVLEATGVTATDGDTVGLRLTGTSLRALKNGAAIGTGTTDASYASGGMGIFDQAGSIFDDFSGPTTAGALYAAVRATHSDGSTTDYTAIADTPRARGQAMLNAARATISGTLTGETLSDISTAHTFDTGSESVVMYAGTAGALNKFNMAGKLITIIYSQALNSGACITPNDYQEWKNFTIWYNTGQLNGSPFGHRGTLPAAASGSYSTVLFSDIRGIGPIDCFHTTGGPLRVISVHLVRCNLNSSFDTAIVINNSCADGSTITLTNCTGLAQYPHSLYPPIYSGGGMGATTRAVSNQDASCITTVYGGTWTSGGASAVNSAALVTLGTLNLFDCALIATGTNALSIQRTGGTLNYSNVTLTGATSGTITDLGAAYVPAPPTDLAATIGDGGVTLAWSRNAVNELGVVLGYATDAAFTLNTGTFRAPQGSVRFWVPQLINGTRYYFRALATNATGDSIYSNVISAVPGRAHRRLTRTLRPVRVARP